MAIEQMYMEISSVQNLWLLHFVDFKNKCRNAWIISKSNGYDFKLDVLKGY